MGVDLAASDSVGTGEWMLRFLPAVAIEDGDTDSQADDTTRVSRLDVYGVRLLASGPSVL